MTERRSDREAPQPTAQLLIAWQTGEVDARNLLITRIYPELTAIASARLRHERGASLSTADLINDAVLRISTAENLKISDRPHLLALASQIMRHILIDHARSKLRLKRGHSRVTLSTHVEGGRGIDLIQLDTTLIRLKAIDAELADLVEMRYFGGMTVEDVSAVTGWSDRTVKRRWQVARAWLMAALIEEPGLD